MSVLVKMKDGRVFCGDLWIWRPLEGWFSIVDNEAPEKIMLVDVESAVNRDVRYNPLGETRDEDLLERATDERGEKEL
jgi:hypothetical protein